MGEAMTFELWQAILGFFTYTTLLVGAMAWLNNQLAKKLATEDFKAEFSLLEARTRELEINLARRMQHP